MKLLFCVSLYLPYVSGITIHVNRLAEHFAKDNEVTILTSQYSNTLPRHEKKGKLAIIRIPVLFTLYKGVFMPLYIWYVYKEVKKAECVVINAPQVEGFLVALAAKLLKRRSICIYHCEITLPKSFFAKILEYILLLSHWITLSLVDTIVVYTQDYANHSILLPHFIKKVQAIPPPIPVPGIDKKFQHTLENRLPKGSNTLVLGVAARISAEKGIEYLIQALTSIKRQTDKEVMLLIAGPKEPIGEGKYYQKISQLLREHKNNIMFFETIPSYKMGSFYRLLDVLVLPSVNSTEAFGMVQVEAMLCGIPVVASDLPGVRVPVQVTGMGKIAKVKDSDDLANKISMVFTYKTEYIKTGQDVKKYFSYASSLQAFHTLFTGHN